MDYAGGREVMRVTPRLLGDTLFVPFLAAVASIGTILFKWSISRILSLRSHTSSNSGQRPDRSDGQWTLAQHIKEHGGVLEFSYQVIRFICAFVLLVLQFGTPDARAIPENTLVDQQGSRWSRIGSYSNTAFMDTQILKLSLSGAYAYVTLLCLLNVFAPKPWAKTTGRHANMICFSTFLVFAYRDLYPLMTIYVQPRDSLEGPVLWLKIAILFFVGVVLPLVMPREYVPFDSKSPMEPNPEQTASILSMVTYSFLDPLILLAHRVPHFGYDKLPPLADYDHTHNLRSASFKHLDPFSGASQRHIFWGFMKVFKFDYFMMAFTISLTVACSFVSPVSIKLLLSYLETGGLDATIKPWVWVSGLFFGPVSTALCHQAYAFFATRTLARCEAIVTQLVFEHALRIRVKAETENADKENSVVSPETVVSPSDDPDNRTTPTPPSIEEELGHSEENIASCTHAPSSSEGTIRPSSPSAKSTSSNQSKSHQAKNAKENEPAPPQKRDASNLIGRINNLVTTDLGNITGARDLMFVLIKIPMQIILCTVFLYVILGWSAFVGLAVMVLLSPIPGWVTRKIQQVQKHRMKKTDARIQIVTEAMNIIRMIKVFGWEKKMEEQISEKREEELVWLWKKQVLGLINGNINFTIPILVMIATYSTYTVIMGQELRASIVFSSMTVFDVLREQLSVGFLMLNLIVTGKVSLDRIDDFLKNTELLDSYVGKDPGAPVSRADAEDGRIGFCESSFIWSADTDEIYSTPSKRKYMLKIDREVFFKPGCLNLIVGPTGSGKTSILMALLGEMHHVPNGPNSWFNLPRTGGVAYAAQESWVQNKTIRDNILFGSPYDEERYNKVIYQCGLERDLELLQAGDQTEVGEKGLTLSGGQRARVTLARAIYSPAQILLLDDILAALDVHTAKWVVDKCFAGDLVEGRTVLLVTHNVAMTQSLAGFVVSVGTGGRIVAQGTVLEVLGADKAIFDELKQDKEVIEKSGEEVDKPATPSSDGKLVVAEEVEVGHLGWQPLKLFFVGLGGNHPALFFSTFLGGLFVVELIITFQTWYLGYWASQYEIPTSEVSVSYYLGIYVVMLVLGLILYIFSFIIFIYGSLRASRYIHGKLMESILGATFRWLDITPVSRIITRCTQDIASIDGQFKDGVTWLTELTIAMITKLFAVVFMTPIFLIPGLAVGVLGGWLAQIYLFAQLPVKRELSNAHAPVVGHFGAAIAGLTSIRAYGAEERFIQESMKRINRYTSGGRVCYNLNRWVCVRIDTIGALFAAGLGAYLVYFQKASASNTGFSLNMAVGFSGMILFWIRSLNMVEITGNSLERIHGYIANEQEAKPTPGGVPSAYWPASGALTVEKLSAKYSQTGPKVLQDISFKINSGERIGVVGRTGSGKSSLALALLRCIITEGDVFYDGIKTSDINLDALRSKITIIPQIPELLSGSLRHNLDPFSQYDDASLNAALRGAGLFALQADMDEDRITLDTPISSGGGNLSVGQRQILALARAIVRGSKLLILDEATSAIDHKTDTAIQSSLRYELEQDTTVITIAHRLQTIMDSDKIMVLDAGRLVEFDTPRNLLRKEKGLFHSLVEESGDKAYLYEMSEGEHGVNPLTI